MAELIRKEDDLNTGREKLNNAIKAFNETVVEGDSSVEAAQARVDSEGNTYSTLKERLDEKETEFSSQLAQTMQQKADKTDLNVEKSRIDNLIALPEGSTTNDARLEDIAIGADGVNYTSPGEAVRKQIKAVNQDLADFTSNGLQKINLNFEFGGISSGSGDDLDPRGDRLRSDFFESDGIGIVIKPSTGYEANLYYYDYEKNYIGNNGYAGDEITTNHQGFLRVAIAEAGESFYDSNNNVYVGIFRNTNINQRISLSENAIKVNEINVDFLNEIVLRDRNEIEASYISGSINPDTGSLESDSTKLRISGYLDYTDTHNLFIVADSLAKVSLRFFKTNLQYEVGVPEYYTGVMDVEKIAKDHSIEWDNSLRLRIVISYQDDRTIESIEDLSSLVRVVEVVDNKQQRQAITFQSDKSSMSIRCAKETTFNDGTPPKVEWYLVEDVHTQRFYKTKDFKTFEHLFTFNALRTSFFYKFGITKNNDIIAVFRTEALGDITTNSDSVRENPYVLLASESYETIHEVDFGDELKPSGWLQNVGFINLPTGETVFNEYTRPSVATASTWVIDGDVTNSANWKATKTIPLSGDTSVGFKHFHCVMYDPFTRVLYSTTGDDDDGAQVWYSLDKGNSWAQLAPPNHSDNEKYCRTLNYIFTEDYVYWASDTAKPEKHFVFRTGRDANGVMDFNNITDLIQIPSVGVVATYGVAHIPELDMLLLCDRSDGSNATSIPVRAYMISTGELLTLGTLYTADGNGHYLGFRTEYTEYYPEDLRIKFGFGAQYSLGRYTNAIKGFGNTANHSPKENVNNLYIKPYKKEDGTYSFRLGVLT